MQVTAISNTIPKYQTKPVQRPKVTTPQGPDRQVEKSIYSKGASAIPFGISMIQDYIYEKSLVKHRHMIDEIDPRVVEGYCLSLGVPCAINKGRTQKDNQVIAYCVFNGMELMRALKMPLPARIDMEPFPNRTLAACYYGPDIYKGFPIGTVVYNLNQDWAHLLDTSLAEHKAKDKFHTTNHFLHTTIHEFGHNVHYHKLFSKFGSPTPDSRFVYNPATERLMEKLNMPPDGSPYITPEVRDIMKQSSGYGSSLLPELFAEEFANAIISNLNFMTLQLEQNPFPIKNLSPELYQVLYETWEGLIDDGQGII